MLHRELAFRLLASAALGYQAFALGTLVAVSVGSSGHGDVAIASVVALAGPILAFWWRPRLLFGVACAVQGVICLFFAYFALIFKGYLSSSALAIACVSYFLACAGVRMRTSTIVGATALVAAILHNAWDQGTSLADSLPFGVVGLCLLGMSYLLPGLQTKQSIGSTPSSGTAS